MFLFLVPDHQRAKNNKYYFEKIIEEEQASTGQQRGDTGEPLLRNPRHIDEYRNSEEFYTYEKLCRGENTQVSIRGRRAQPPSTCLIPLT